MQETRGLDNAAGAGTPLTLTLVKPVYREHDLEAHCRGSINIGNKQTHLVAKTNNSWAFLCNHQKDGKNLSIGA